MKRFPIEEHIYYPEFSRDNEGMEAFGMFEGFENTFKHFEQASRSFLLYTRLEFIKYLESRLKILKAIHVSDVLGIKGKVEYLWY